MGRRFHRYCRRKDANHCAVSKALESCGMIVLDLSLVGQGIPDLLASTKKDMWLVEVKTKSGRLSPRQIKFWESWAGKPLVRLESPEQAEAWALEAQGIKKIGA